jgi:hypothetical protein
MLVLVCLEIVLILTQDGCMVCAERTIGSEIILDAPMDLLGDISHVESHFNAFGDTVVSVEDRYTVCAKRSSEIVLDAPDGTHR